jgi:hypothetical protein
MQRSSTTPSASSHPHLLIRHFSVIHSGPADGQDAIAAASSSDVRRSVSPQAHSKGAAR